MITRTAMVDDDGSGTTGTIFNNAWKTALYDQIDAALVAGGTLTGDLLFTDALYDIGKSGATRPRDGFFSRNVTVGGVLTVNGYGDHIFSASGAGGNRIRVRNTSSGTGAAAALEVGNDGDAQAGQFLTLSSTYTTSGDLQAWATAIRANQSGGLSIGALHASGVIRFYSGGSTERMRIDAAGLITVNATSAALTLNPQANTNLASLLLGDGSSYGWTAYKDTAAGGVSGIGEALLFYSNKAPAGVRLTLSPDARLMLGGAAIRATTAGTKHLNIFDGTAPAGTLANGVTLYSAAGKLWAMDAAGTATKLTP